MRLSFRFGCLGRERSPGPDTGKDPGEERPGNGHLRHLKDRPAGVAYDLGPYLYRLELDAGKRPAGYLGGKGEAPQEVAQVAGEHEQSKAYLFGGGPGAGEPGPGQGILALLDPIFTGTPFIVEAPPFSLPCSSW